MATEKSAQDAVGGGQSHYSVLAPEYDKFYEIYSHARANFIKRFFPLNQDDQLVDIGGGTAQVSLILKADIGMTKPVVCVDPNRDMLSVAEKNGAIAIHSTAESFLSKPDYPLKTVFFIGCVHHFPHPDVVFENLAKHMPEDGMGLILKYMYANENSNLPFFKAAMQSFVDVNKNSKSGLKQLSTLIESKGLKCKFVSDTELIEYDKSLWYDSIRNRFVFTLNKFSDAELELGIAELDEKFKDQDVFRFDATMEAIIITKN